MRYFFILFSLFLPCQLLGQDFFAEEALKEVRSWQLVEVEGPMVEAFSTEEEGLGPVEGVHIVINIPARRLHLYEGEELLRTYPVAVGSGRYRTPVGRRYLSEVTWNPWWFPPDAEWAKNDKPTPPGPGNPLGRVKMSLGGDIFLHGTNKEGSVGHPVSHGCMRMRNRDATSLAWFFQSHYSSQTDLPLLERYRQSPRQSFRVRLDRPVPVEIRYDRVAVNEEDLEIYPNIYGRPYNFWSEIMEELSQVGIPPWKIDPSMIEDLIESRETKMVSLYDLLGSHSL